MNDDTRIARCQREIVETLNRAQLPASVMALLLENILLKVETTVRQSGQDQEAAPES